MTNLRPLSFSSLLSFALCAAVAAEAASPAGPPPAPQVTIGGQSLLELGFEHLAAFPYDIVDGGTGATKAEIEAAAKRDQIPEWIHIYDGKKIVLTGYMLPLQLDNGLAKKFVLMKDTNTCCFGGTPRMNDYVVCQMEGAGVESIQDIPVQLTGVIHIAEKREDGYVVSLFTMDGEKFLGPKK
jgi:hypothetical protein